MIKRPMCMLLIGLIIGIYLIEMLGMSWIWRSPTGPILDNSETFTQKITASGIVFQQESKLYKSKEYSYIYLTQTTLILNQRKYPIRNIKCVIEGQQEPLLEERITVMGFLSIPKTATNPGEFDLQTWERARKIDYYIEKCQLCTIQQKKNGWISRLTNLRNYLIDKIMEIFPESEAGILIAMLLGTKEYVDSDAADGFQAAGISHMMAKKCTNGYICVQC